MRFDELRSSMLQKYNVSRFVGAAGDFFGAKYILANQLRKNY